MPCSSMARCGRSATRRRSCPSYATERTGRPSTWTTCNPTAPPLRRDRRERCFAAALPPVAAKPLFGRSPRHRLDGDGDAVVRELVDVQLGPLLVRDQELRLAAVVRLPHLVGRLLAAEAGH